MQTFSNGSPPTLADAQAVHRSGDFPRAAEAYQAVLVHEPDQPDALHGLGLALSLAGQAAEGEPHLRRALSVHPDAAHYHNSLGICLRGQDRFVEAGACFEEALRLRPDYPIAVSNLARLRGEQGRLDEAAALYERAGSDKRASAETRLELARTQRRQKKLDLADKTLVESLRQFPDHVELLTELGRTRLQGRLFEPAIAPLERATQLAPERIDLKCHLAIALAESDRDADALAVANAARELAPDAPAPHEALGLLAYRRGTYEDALEHLLAAQTQTTGSASVYTNLASVYQQLGMLNEAADALDKALWLDPAKADARTNRSFLLLKQGRLREGFREYEWRRLDPKRTYPRLPKPVWDGGDISGKTLLLYGEQGLGDTLQFARYGRLVKERHGGDMTVHLAAQKPLQPLLSRTPGIDKLLILGDPVASEFDCYAPLMSLPALFHETVEDITSSEPYLLPDPERVTRWKQVIDALPGTVKVGISWQGNPKFVDDHQRSIPLSVFRTLSQIEGVTLVSLQKGHGEEQLQSVDFEVQTLDGLDEEGGAFEDTAAVMHALDYVVTSDTAMAHLCGGLGVSGVICLAKTADWRWFEERDDSPWYPSLTLLRQEARGDWPELFTRVAQRVRDRFADRLPSPEQTDD